MDAGKHVICVSWNEVLSKSREALLRSLGVKVSAVVYEKEAMQICKQDADLLVLGHSVPKDQKRAIIKCFRQHSNAPILSLLSFGDIKLPEATYGATASDPAEVLQTVRKILSTKAASN